MDQPAVRMVSYGQSLSRPDASMEPRQSDVPHGFTHDSHKDTTGYWEHGTGHDNSSPKLRQGMDTRRHKDLAIGDSSLVTTRPRPSSFSANHLGRSLAWTSLANGSGDRSL